MRAMRVGELGEFRLIDKLARLVGERESGLDDRAVAEGFRLRLSIGDDAAAWDGRAGTTVITTDTLVEGVHFRLPDIGWADLGWKAMAVNLSDVAAMGCAPLYSVVTLGLSSQLPVDGIVEMYRGMLEACRVHGGAIVGGDIVRSSALFVTVAMVGAAPVWERGDSSEQPILTRGSARHGDKIAVTGDLGRSSGGLRMLQGGLRFDENTTHRLTEAHSRPTPRVAEGMVLARHGVTAAMDISDGLVADLGKLCEASDVGATLRSDLVPVHDSLKQAYPDDWLSLGLSGGEDYELLFSAPAGLMGDVAEAVEVPVTVIGDIVAGRPGVSVVDQDGAPVTVERGGWDHFSRP